ncbi:MAG: GntR family transcriptional regulator [Ostreibacterium sp.]
MSKLKKQQTDKLSNKIYKELQELLISGQFKPGERLRVADLMEQTGTSLTPIRESLIRLVSENAIDMPSPRSFTVPKLSKEKYQEIYSIRIALEGLATEKATNNISDNDIKRLEKIHKKFIEAEKNKCSREAQLANRAFHFLIYKNANMPILLNNIENLWSMIGPILNEFYAHLFTDYAQAEEHLNIIEHLKNKNPKGARIAMCADIKRSVSSIEQCIEDN